MDIGIEFLCIGRELSVFIEKIELGDFIFIGMELSVFIEKVEFSDLIFMSIKKGVVLYCWRCECGIALLLQRK